MQYVWSLEYTRKFSGQQDADAGSNLKQSRTRRHLRLAFPCHEVGRGEYPRSVSRSHDYTATSRSFIIPPMRGGGRRDLSLRGKIAKPLFGGRGEEAQPHLDCLQKTKTPQNLLARFGSPFPAYDFINSGGALPHLKPEPRNCF